MDNSGNLKDKAVSETMEAEIKIKENNNELIDTSETNQIKQTRYEHMFKFLWFFGAMFIVGSRYFVTFDVNENSPVFYTIGPALMATGLLFIIIIVGYLICENNIFITDKSLNKNYKKHINYAEILFTSLNTLIRIFLSKIILVYFSFLSISTLINFNIYEYLTKGNSEKILIIIAIGTLVIVAILKFISMIIEGIKLKNRNELLKISITKVHIVIIESIGLFAFLFVLFITLHNGVSTNVLI